jgi:hypothetical protein
MSVSCRPKIDWERKPAADSFLAIDGYQNAMDYLSGEPDVYAEEWNK